MAGLEPRLSATLGTHITLNEYLGVSSQMNILPYDDELGEH